MISQLQWQSCSSRCNSCSRPFKRRDQLLSSSKNNRRSLYCPGIAKSLVSVSKLTHDYPCSFEFDNNRVFVKDKQTRRVLSQGNTREGLYSLKSPKPLAYYSTRQISTSDEVWHRRLGHPHDQILKYLSQSKSIEVNKSTLKMC